MYIPAQTLDDLLRRVFEKLLKSKNHIRPTRGSLVEETGVLLKLGDPRARISRSQTKGTIFSCLGELLWYLSGTNNADFIGYYLQRYQNDAEKGKIWGGYGPRLFNWNGTNQLQNVVNLLRSNRVSRRAVIQLFDAHDIATSNRSKKRHKDVPCTCTLQCMIRKGKLEMHANMRSNDAYFGLPHDTFAFTMLQEILARELSVEPGIYKHCVGSLHLYEEHFEGAQRFLEEGWQSSVPMPAMPQGNPWPSVNVLLKAEKAFRTGRAVKDTTIATVNPYWQDLIRLLQVFRCVKTKNPAEIPKIKRSMSSKVFYTYIQRRQRVPDHGPILKQPLLLGTNA